MVRMRKNRTVALQHACENKRLNVIVVYSRSSLFFSVNGSSYSTWKMGHKEERTLCDSNVVPMFFLINECVAMEVCENTGGSTCIQGNNTRT